MNEYYYNNEVFFLNFEVAVAYDHLPPSFITCRITFLMYHKYELQYLYSELNYSKLFKKLNIPKKNSTHSKLNYWKQFRKLIIQDRTCNYVIGTYRKQLCHRPYLDLNDSFLFVFNFILMYLPTYLPILCGNMVGGWWPILDPHPKRDITTFT